MAGSNFNQELDDATVFFVDTADTTKKIAFQASGITTGNTRTITMPDSDVDLGDVGSGGGLAGTSVKTIGTGGDYSDVAAAIAGESSPYHFVLVSNVTEDSAITPGNGEILYLDLDRYILTMGTNRFTSAAAVSIYIRGAGIDSGAEIDYTATTTNSLFGVTGSTSIIDLEGFVYDNNSSSGNSELGQTGVMRVRNCKLDLPNVSFCGFVNTNDGSYIENCHIIGGGTSCSTAISTRFSRGLYVAGTFNSAANAIQVSADGSMTGVVFDHSTNAARIGVAGADATLSNITNNSAQDLDIVCTANSCEMTNINLAQGNIDFNATDFHKLSNVHCDTLDVTDTGCTNILVSNSRIVDALTVAGDRIKFSNCDIIGGATVNSGANNNIFTGCQFGADAGSGALTLTINATSTGTIAIGNISDVAIVDNGTGSAVANNIVY